MDEGLELAPPGAGVPRWQVLAGRYLLLPCWCVRSRSRLVEILCEEGEDLLRLGEGIGDELQLRRVLVPPQIGLEDSSRAWSFAMVLEHLVIIGERVAGVIVELSHGRVPADRFGTAQLKPRGATAAAAAREEFRKCLERFRGLAAAERYGDPASPTRYPHPWFGPLTARQWLGFLPMHQRIHARQARRIVGALRRPGR